ncbi:MAG: BamA/TamA family outer membrane protein [Saprospiraceae bacterium]|nr:BamA/TamA family outer membrane protein [Saprospiraceae bacterium]
MQLYRYILLLSATTFIATLAQAQGTQTTYGKNRVQYHQDFDEWMKYESDNFITYWYGEARNIGQSVVMIAEEEFNNVQRILEHRINEKIQIIAFTDLTDLKQSNIGSEETFTNTGGQTKIVGNKIFVYFDGDHKNLRRQVREGIASVYLDAMLFGSNLQEIVQNAVMMNLPPWFKDGLSSYAGEEWNTDLDNQLRDVIMSEDFENFDKFAEENPKLAGHALWYYIAENFGKSTVSNLLYLTRINRSIESGFLYVLGSSYNIITESWLQYFKKRYTVEDGQRDQAPGKEIPVKNRRNLPISQVKISPNGRQIAYVLNEIGRFSIYLQDVQTGERKLILKEGFRNPFQATDYNYPIIAWSPTSQDIAIIYEKRDAPKLITYAIASKKFHTEDLSTLYQRVNSVEYIDPNALVFSATVRGYSDVYVYFQNTRQSQRITNDFYDDLDASVVNIRNKKGILFASNRPDSLILPMNLDTILPTGNFDIFYYDLENRTNELVQITHTPFADEREPEAIDTTYFAYLSDRSGVNNREMGYLEDYVHHLEQVISLKDGTEIILHADSTMSELDSTLVDTILIRPVIKQRAINHPNSNYNRSIVTQHTSPRSGRMVEMLIQDGKSHLYWIEIDTGKVITPLLSRHRQREINQLRRQGEEISSMLLPVIPKPQVTEQPPAKVEVPPKPSETKQDTGKIDIDNYYFQTRFEEKEKPAQVAVEESKKEEKQTGQKEEQPGNISIVLPSELPKIDIEPEQKEVYRFRPGRITPYRLQFRTDFVTTQLDNSLLFEGMETFAANTDGFNYPPPGILMKANFKDLFEDYEFEGGIRIPTTFNGSEYFLVFNDKKKRLDKRYAIYRRNNRYTEESNFYVPDRREVNILLGQVGLRYPLDIFRSIRATGTIRRDRVTHLATYADTLGGQFILGDPTRSDQRAGLKLEYVFDNTFDVALNIKNGTRYKIFVEAVKKFDLNIGRNEGTSLDFAKGAMGIIGFDARHYQRITKYGVLATRLAGAASFGSERMLYFLGGVDNWLFPSQEDDIPIPAAGSDDISFQTLATNLRGFGTNIRNGNSYVVANAELRFPVFRMISNRIKSPFLRNFQLVGFFDVGTAWTGTDPFSQDSPLNTKVIPNGNDITIKINYFRDPIVAGYGGGIRSTLFGYFIRLDYAWGIETRQIQDPRLYISLGMDF